MKELDDGNKRIRFVKTAAETAGALLTVEVHYRPGSSRPPLHFHPSQEETFLLEAGTTRVIIDGAERVLRPGERLVIPPGIKHTLWNDGPEEARAQWETRPALRTEELFRALAALHGSGRLGSTGAPSLLDAAPLLREFRRELVLASPPPALQTCAFCVLAPVARLLGRHHVWADTAGP